MIFWQVLTQRLKLTLHFAVALGGLEERRIENAFGGASWRRIAFRAAGLQGQSGATTTQLCGSRWSRTTSHRELLIGGRCYGAIVITLRARLLDGYNRRGCLGAGITTAKA